MAPLKVNFDDLDHLLARIQVGAQTYMVPASVDLVAESIAARAKELCPYEVVADSIVHYVEADASGRPHAQVEALHPGAHDIEFGVRHSAPHPFLRPAFDEAHANLPTQMEARWGNAEEWIKEHMAFTGMSREDAESLWTRTNALSDKENRLNVTTGQLTDAQLRGAE